MSELTLDALAARVAALEDAPADSIAVPNTNIFNSEGEVIVANHGETGFALLNASEGVEAAVAPGEREFESFKSEGIENDTIGALQKAGVLVTGNLFHNIPTPFLSAGPGVINVHTKTTVPTGQERSAGQNWLKSANSFELIQFKGVPGEKIKLSTEVPAGRVGMDMAVYNQKGELIGSGGGNKVEFTFPADGILYVAISDNSLSKGEPLEPGLASFAMSVEETSPNPFEFPTFKLPEGFLYNIAAGFTFQSDAAISASGLVVVEIDCEVFSGTPVSFRAGCPYYCQSELGEEEGFTFEVQMQATAVVPRKQPEGAADGGVKVLPHPSAPGSETPVKWIKQSLLIQQVAA
jgi:hypothetical protein